MAVQSDKKYRAGMFVPGPFETDLMCKWMMSFAA